MLKNRFFNNKGPFSIDKLLKLSGTLNSKIYKKKKFLMSKIFLMLQVKKLLFFIQ